MAAERRQHSRFKSSIPVIVHRPYTERQAEAVDISVAGGTIIKIQKYYAIGQEIYLELALTPQESVFANARVSSVYPHSKEASAYKITIQFLEMSDPDRSKLESYLKNLQKPQSSNPY